jgi:hypothetical protein
MMKAVELIIKLPADILYRHILQPNGWKVKGFLVVCFYLGGMS